MSQRLALPSSASEFALGALAISGDLLMDTARRIEAADADPVESVHELRVAIRRVRAHLRVFANVFDPVWLDATIAQLRDLARVVGRARDLDVICVRLETLVGSLPERDQSAAATMLTQLRLDRIAAFRDVVAALRGPDRAAAIEDLAVVTARRPLATDAENVVIEDLVVATRREWRRLRKSVRGAKAEPSAENLHRVRVRAKTLRYSLETLEPVLHRSARHQAKALVELQDRLGELQDAVVIERWLRVTREAGLSDAFLFGELVGLERARGERARATWRDEWRRVSRRKMRRWNR